VWDFSIDIGLVARAIHEYVERWKGPTPLISISCPVVVRLVQVSYPSMVDQLIPVQLPREIAGREVKRRYSTQLGVSEDDVAAIYITPCQAKAISILEPAEGVVSHLDGALGISDIYNAILAYTSMRKGDVGKPGRRSIIRNSTFLHWHMSEGLGHVLAGQRYLLVTGLANIIQVFNDIEKGKLRQVDFLDAYNCWSGCTAGNLTVANLYVTQSKMHALCSKLPEMDRATEAEIDRRYPREDFSLERPIRPRPIRGRVGSLKERVQMVQQAEDTLARLPGLNCGLCGAPTCKELARDISMGDATTEDCVFISEGRLTDLRRAYSRTPG
jgi:hypothetical protein